jgi:hypothetical protein
MEESFCPVGLPSKIILGSHGGMAGNNLRYLFAGIGIAAVIILSSVPLIRYEELHGKDSVGFEADFCTAKHEKQESECKADREHHCVWCISRAVPGMCYDEESAHKLPPSVFKCEFGASQDNFEVS